ncbi:MAG TPA: ATP-binding protein [Ktedonobacteraceae bacterium]|jgi:heavy metal sensor kinase|nr:ATP-binding protein [Ktedonobacteraceae bacterium]
MPRYISALPTIWPLNIRTQMMLWYTLVFTLLMILAGTLFYLHLQSALEANVDAELQQHAREIADGINDNNGTLHVIDMQGILPGLVDPNGPDSDDTPGANNRQAGNETYPDVNLEPLVRILNNKGESVYTSPAFQHLQVPAISITQPMHHAVWQGTLLAKNGQPVRLYSEPLFDDGRLYAIIQVGESLANLGSTLRSVALELLFIGPPVLLLGFLGSYWLAGFAFTPIKKMTNTVRCIEAGDLHERVPVPKARDELQTLAVTFNSMIAQLEKSFARQRRFVADAAHELRTPVAAIRSMTDIMLERETPVEREEYMTVLRDINAEAERLGRLINDLLVLARSDENEVAFEHEPVRLDQLARDVITTMEILATEKGIQLKVQADEPATVMGDEVRLIQVIMNLMDNAINYTNDGGTIRVTVKAEEENARLMVSDTGTGIAPEHLPHIFERFYRVDPARSRAAGGTGLGLAIVDWIVRAHQGSIAVESQVGKGTTFTVILPLAKSGIEILKKS